MNYHYCNKITLLLLLVISWLAAPAQQLPESYLEDYHQAVAYTNQHKNTISQICQSYQHDPAFIFSLAFPELTRYHRFRDQLELAVSQLDALLDLQQIDFSVGPLQMKPSFARDIICKVKTNQGLKTKYDTLLHLQNREPARFLQLLAQLDWQLHLLNAYYDICLLQWGAHPALQQFRWMATAYNAGMYHSQEKLNALSMQNTFPFGWQYKGNQVSYYQWAYQFFLHDAHLLRN